VLLRALLVVWALAFAGWATALTAEQALAIVDGTSDERIEAMNAAVAEGDAQVVPLLEALLADELKLFEGRVLRVQDDKVTEVPSGRVLPLPEGADDIVNNNRMRRAIGASLAAFRLFDADLAVRAKAVNTLRADVDESQLPLLDKALARESDAAQKERIEGLRATVLIAAEDPARRADAARRLADSRDPATRALLMERQRVETEPTVRTAIAASLRAVEARLAWGEGLGVLFTGVSLGSILMLAALGLAITYGLMGVINMAHGELIMVGAYATWLVQNLFRTHLPGWFDAYVLAAIPVSFAVAALVGAVMERSVIRWLYGRPLETLLATWGISLILMQTVRSLFGAQNVAVENPSWLSGGVQVLPNLTLPWNRVAIIVFALAVLAGVAWIIGRTRLGLFVRGVTQNRRMAACVGVNTARIDTWAFSVGAGVAGLAGCALSQIGNVGPDLGQSYIVDSFMVVVLGGVGQIAGTVVAGLGLGLMNKLLEGWQGAVLAKIMVLVFIVGFIQKRPQGLFALKGRSAEA
jgi:urea transport system permease protein